MKIFEINFQQSNSLNLMTSHEILKMHSISSYVLSVTFSFLMCPARCLLYANSVNYNAFGGAIPVQYKTLLKIIVPISVLLLKLWTWIQCCFVTNNPVFLTEKVDSQTETVHFVLYNHSCNLFFGLFANTMYKSIINKKVQVGTRAWINVQEKSMKCIYSNEYQMFHF